MSTVPSLTARQAASMMPRPADRRVHHAKAPQPLVAVGRDLGQVVHQHLAGGDVAKILQVVEFLARWRRAGCAPAARSCAPAPSAGACRGRRISSSRQSMWLRYGIAGLEQRLALLQPVFVLASGRRCGGGRERMTRFQVLVVLDHQVAGGTAGEDLDRRRRRGRVPASPVRRCWSWCRRHRARCRTRRALDVVLLPGQPLGIGDGGRGVRHVEHRGQAAEHRAPWCRWGWSRPPCRRDRADGHAGRSGRAGHAGRGHRPRSPHARCAGRRERRSGHHARRHRWSRCPRAGRRCRRAG